MKHYKKESIIAPLFKLLEVVFDLLVPMVVAQIIVCMQSFALSASIPPIIVIGFVSTNTLRQLMIRITSAIIQSFLI